MTRPRIRLLEHGHTLAVVLLLGLLAMTARNAADPDLWWHLRTGEWILETGTIPHTDSFSFTRAGSPWVSHEWLSEVVFYGIFEHGGMGALIILAAVVTTAGFVLLYLRCRAKPSSAAATVALGALAAAPAWGVRPQMFTFALASLMLWLVERGEKRPLCLLWIPPLFLIWLNLHAGFALGPALLLCIAVGLGWEAASGATPWREVRPHLLRILGVLLVCMALVPLNPSGSQLYRYPLDVLRSPEMRSFIAEWHPPDFHELRYLTVLALCLALLAAFALPRSRPKGRVVVPLGLTFLAAFDAVRHIPIFVLLAVPVIASAFAVEPRSLGRLSRVEPGLRRAFRGAILVLMAGFAMVRWDSLLRSQATLEGQAFPLRAAAYLRSRSLPPRMFAHYDWGGYVIWRLYPEYRVFVDGRADLYGDDLLRQFQTALQLKNGWMRVLNDWQVESVLVPPSSPLAQGLLLDANWQTEYEDEQAILLVRRP